MCNSELARKAVSISHYPRIQYSGADIYYRQQLQRPIYNGSPDT
jgi:hypothetical protein